MDPTGKRRAWTAAVLGFSLGLVLYAVYWHWLAVIPVIILTVAWKTRLSKSVLAPFLAAFGAVALPFAFAVLRAGMPPYIHSLAGFHPRIALSYLQVIFWGLPVDYYTYQPVWGGFLNPLLASLFLLGFLEALRSLRNGTVFWLVAAFAAFLLPGFLSPNSECYRTLPVLAAVIPLAALGSARLLSGFSRNRAFLVLLLLVLPSAGFDFFRLAGPYHRLWDSPGYWLKSTKSICSYRACSILESRSRTEGPGVAFADFTPGNSDQTFSLGSYGFNGEINPRITLERAKWAAVMVNIHYQPFLQKRFGGGKTYWLAKDLHVPDGGFMLWVVPLTDSNRPVFRQWLEADRALYPFLDRNFQDTGYPWGESCDDTLRSLQAAYPAFRGDPFLESCYWEKMSDFCFKTRRTAMAFQSLHRAIQKGYPAAHLYEHLGVLYMIHSRPREARQAFREAARAPFNFTDSPDLLRELEPTRPPR